MDKNIANAMLLRLNKQDQIEALKSIGFTTVNENTPASDIAKYMQWSGTLLDLSLATLRIEDGEQVFFTASEWNSMSANNRSKYIRIGIRLRAECHQFIIAKSACVDAGGNKTFKWGGYGTDLRGLKNYGSGNQGLYDTFDGKENTDVIIETLAGVKDTQGTVGAPAAEVARAYKACTLESDGIEDTTVWNLPALGELMLMAKYKTEINELITSMFGNQNIFTNDWYWSSTEYDASSSWYVNFSGGNVNAYSRQDAYRVRPLAATGNIIYDILLSSIFEASEDCARQKRTSTDCVEFYNDYQSALVRLWYSIIYGEYVPDFSKVFIRTYPVYREVFAAAFIDRVVHHWIALRIEPILEERFREQGNVSKNCRKGEGCLSAVHYLNNMIVEVSENYTADAYIFKDDLFSFFMSISKSLVWEMLNIFVRDNYKGDDIECLLYLLAVTIFHCPQNKCIRRSPVSMWDKLPSNKSLFHNDPDRGVAIGNLPSQLIANFLASVFDYYVMVILGFRHYVRFVDDFCIVVTSPEEILSKVHLLDGFLKEQLLLRLHPKKLYLQHYKKGVLFVGAFILPGRIYVSNRVVGNTYNAVRKFNKIAENGFAEAYVEKFVSTMNSYYGLMKHFATYNIRRKIAAMLLPEWWEYVYIEGHFEKFVLKNKYNHRKQLIKHIKKHGSKKYLTAWDC